MMAYVEIPWAYDTAYRPSSPGPTHDAHPLFFPGSAISDREECSAADLRQRGYRLVALGPPWPGSVYGTSIWHYET